MYCKHTFSISFIESESDVPDVEGEAMVAGAGRIMQSATSEYLRYQILETEKYINAVFSIK